MTWFIERNDTIETEISESPIIDTFHYHVRWTTPCTYELLFISATDTLVNSLIKKMGGKDPIFNIVEGTDKYYLEKSLSLKKLDTVWIR